MCFINWFSRSSLTSGCNEKLALKDVMPKGNHVKRVPRQDWKSSTWDCEPSALSTELYLCWAAPFRLPFLVAQILPNLCQHDWACIPYCFFFLCPFKLAVRVLRRLLLQVEQGLFPLEQRERRVDSAPLWPPLQRSKVLPSPRSLSHLCCRHHLKMNPSGNFSLTASTNMILAGQENVADVYYNLHRGNNENHCCLQWSWIGGKALKGHWTTSCNIVY